jgi:ComF family protein
LIKKSLWLLKYNGKRRLAELFAQSVYPRIIEELSDLAPLENFTKPILIPIPLSNKRFRERGFNQSELICKYLMKIDRENNQCNFELIDNVLIKPKETIHQAKIENRNERLKNLKGTFTVKNQELIKKRNIILIDDITTTGATLNEAKKILKENGANKIIAFTIAH